MFRTSSVHPQELLCRDCICRLWYAYYHIPHPSNMNLSVRDIIFGIENTTIDDDDVDDYGGDDIMVIIVATLGAVFK